MSIKQLSPDLLRSTIVEVRYKSENDPYVFLIGRIKDQLEEQGFKYKSPTPTPPSHFNIQVDYNFHSESTVVTFTPDRIVFDKKGKYPLWDKYQGEIQKVIQVIGSHGLKFTRVGLRYINEIRDVNIFEKLKDHLKIGFDRFETKYTSLKTEIQDEPFRIVLNVGNGGISEDRSHSVSHLDIDVMRDDNISNTEELLSTIENCHSKEKEIFEELLDKDYLKSLNPKYHD